MKKYALIFILTLAGTLPPVFSADTTGKTALESETEKIRNALSSSKITVQEKHDNYALLGRILHLSGDIEGAAAAWMNAAYAEPGNRDDNALLESVSCYMAMGEWEAALTPIQTVSSGIRDNSFASRKLFLKAQYLAAQVEAFRSGNELMLYALTDNPEYAEERPAIYFMSWKLSGNDKYKLKLFAEYPESPEALALSQESRGKKYVSDAAASPWFLHPGRENMIIDMSTAEIAVKIPVAAEESTTGLQTGLFSNKNNALVQAAALNKAGFRADIVKRLVGQSEYWAVSVPFGDDINKTIIALKEAGYESFPVY